MRYELLAALSLSALSARSGRLAAQDTFPAADRIVAVGDVHGDFAQFTLVLRQAGVIDDKNHWAGGKTVLVQNGDVPDRGPDTRRILELLMALETEAEKAGGKVHALIGNHEVMNIVGDLRYVTPAEFEAFRTPKSEALQLRAFAALADSTKKNDAQYKNQWMTEHPPGWVEQRLAFEGNGRYATWIRGHNALLKIGDYLFLHGGIGPKFADQSVASLNAEIKKGIAPGEAGGLGMDPEGPLWYRGLTAGDEALLIEHVDHALANFGVKHIVIGHTVTAGAVMTRYDGKVIMIDVGLSAVYGGPPACLVIEQGVAYALHRGKKLELPMGGDPLPYYKAAAALDPPPSRLQKLIDQMAAAHPPD